jgi:tRNA(fMet)-specific endonuclease VapC
MRRFLLDTNILIALTKKHPCPAERLSSVPAKAVLLSTVVLAEIEYGIAKSTRKEHNRTIFERLLQGFQILPFNETAAGHYGPIRAALERRGELIGPYDLMIAAQARAENAVLVTDNVQDFQRVEGLIVENWLVGEQA